MHRISSRSTRRFVAALVLAILVAGLAAASVAAASPEPVASPDAAAASPSPDPSPAPTTITCRLSRAAIVFGDTVEANGVVTPAVEGQEVTVRLSGEDVATVVTGASGAYSLVFTPRRGGSVDARVVADGTTTEPQTLAVKLKVSVGRGAAVPFLKTRFVVNVAPSAYSGVVTVDVAHRGVRVGSYKVRVRDGRAVCQIPLRGVDGFTLTFTLPAGDGLAARSLQSKVQVKPRTLKVGSTGAYVKGMLTGLQRLFIRTPGMGSRFTTQTSDAVMAFQKAYGLSRSYVFDTACWRKLDGAKPIKPRHASPRVHIEVDKGRQILMVVKNGAVSGLICVSTGATGNTPEGAFHIQQKHPATSTFTGGGILYRTMGFFGNFAIHGYAPVPPYPASHGCVREPMWVADWTYNQSWVGETVYLYH